MRKVCFGNFRQCFSLHSARLAVEGPGRVCHGEAFLQSEEVLSGEGLETKASLAGGDDAFPERQACVSGSPHQACRSSSPVSSPGRAPAVSESSVSGMEAFSSEDDSCYFQS